MWTSVFRYKVCFREAWPLYAYSDLVTGPAFGLVTRPGQAWLHQFHFQPHQKSICHSTRLYIDFTCRSQLYFGHIWQYIAIWLYMGHIWPYMAIYGHIWPYITIYGHIWPHMAILLIRANDMWKPCRQPAQLRRSHGWEISHISWPHDATCVYDLYVVWDENCFGIWNSFSCSTQCVKRHLF